MVVFQDQAMYARTSFAGSGVQKRAKFEKMVCFGSYWKILERTWGTYKEKLMQLRVYFHTWKIRVKGVFWKFFYNDDIQPEIQVVAPGLVLGR